MSAPTVRRYVKNFGGIWQGEEDFKDCYLASDADAALAYWREQARWAAREYMTERECYHQLTSPHDWKARCDRDAIYQRAAAIVEDAE